MDCRALCPADAAAASMADCFQAEARAAIDASYTQPDADRPGRWALVVGGTPRADQIHISQEEEWTVVRIHSAGNVTARRSKFRTARLSRIEVYGQGGDDNIQIEERVTLPALLYCGDGNNFVHTGGGPAIVVGGEGDNVIEGGTSAQRVDRRPGPRHLKAGPRGDILVAGWTDYDADLGALRAILKQWAAPEHQLSRPCSPPQDPADAGPRASRPCVRHPGRRSQSRLVPGSPRGFRKR